MTCFSALDLHATRLSLVLCVVASRIILPPIGDLTSSLPERLDGRSPLFIVGDKDAVDNQIFEYVTTPDLSL